MGVVGAGRVGAVLGSALRAAGHSVVGASAVSEDSRDRVDALLPGVPVLEVPEIVERAELVLLTVPDDALAGLVQGIADTGGWQAGQIVVHTAGRYGTGVLAPAQRAGAIPVALHPAMTFTGTSIDLSRLVGCPFAVTAPAPVLPIGQALVVEIGGEPVALPESARPLYHAALAHGANHLVTLVTQAMRVLGRAGVDEPGLYLGPLLTAALDGTLRDGELALTGPVLRGDAGTVAEHLASLVALAAEDSGLADLPRPTAPSPASPRSGPGPRAASPTPPPSSCSTPSPRRPSPPSRQPTTTQPTTTQPRSPRRRPCSCAPGRTCGRCSTGSAAPAPSS